METLNHSQAVVTPEGLRVSSRVEPEPSKSLLAGGAYRHSSHTNIAETFRERGWTPPHASPRTDAQRLAQAEEVLAALIANLQPIGPYYRIPQDKAQAVLANLKEAFPGLDLQGLTQSGAA